MKNKRTLAYLFGLLLILMCTSACGKEDNLPVMGGDVYSGVPTKESDADEKNVQEKKEIIYIIEELSFEEEYIRLFNTTNGKILEKELTDSTILKDKYGNLAGNATIVPGRMVTIDTNEKDGRLTCIQISNEAWEQESVENYTIDWDKNMFRIGNSKYRFEDSVPVFNGDEIITLLDIQEGAVLRVSGVDKQVMAITVQSGLGTIELVNTENFEGGWICVGNEEALKITKDMVLQVPEGHYEVKVAKNGYGDMKEVTVEADDTVVLDLSQFRAQEEKYGLVQFVLQPDSTVLTIDGKIVDDTAPLRLKYGAYRLKVSSAEYGEISRILVVSSPEAQIVINMAAEAEADAEQEEAEEEAEKTEDSTSSSTSSETTTSDTTTSDTKNDSSTTADAEETLTESQLNKLSSFISTLLD